MGALRFERRSLTRHIWLSRCNLHFDNKQRRLPLPGTTCLAGTLYIHSAVKRWDADHDVSVLTTGPSALILFHGDDVYLYSFYRRNETWNAEDVRLITYSFESENGGLPFFSFMTVIQRTTRTQHLPPYSSPLIPLHA
jgi:hypothetical protein